MTTATAATPTTVSPSAGSIWRTWRGGLAIAGVVLLGAVVIGLLAAGGRTGVLDPDGVDQQGSRAVATLLRAHGVDVIRAQGVSDATQARPGDTVLVVGPDLLTVEQAQELRSTGADLILIAPTREDIVSTFLPGALPTHDTSVQGRDPGCDLRPAVRAGKALMGGVTYTVNSDTDVTAVSRCYLAGDASLLQATGSDGHLVTFLGTGTPLHNDRLAHEGDAALMLDLLGANSRLIWAMPSLEDLPQDAPKSLGDLLPRWVVPATLQLFFAALLVALWRARRLGPVVDEPLPVVVRAAEATEGRARLYRRAHDRGRAAAQLRRATLERLIPLVGLSGPVHQLDPAAVASAVSSRTTQSESSVRRLLYGGEPSDDGALVVLAAALDELERGVRRT